jgi:hypothetical protein
LLLFLETCVAPMGVLADHIKCFRLLDRMIKLFGLGAEKAVQHIDTIEKVVADHAKLYAALYSDVIKPKFHHLFHVVDHMRQTRRLLSCWVTERKHRTVKALANHIFRHFEKALTIDMLNIMVDRAISRPELFLAESLLSAKAVISNQFHGIVNMPCFSATKAMLLCGTVCKGDIVMLSDRRVASTQGFYAIGNGIDAHIVCIVRLHEGVGANRWKASHEPTVAVPSANVLQALSWYQAGDDIVVLPPLASATW